MATAQPTTAQRALVLVDVQQDYLSGPLQIRYPPVGESLKQILRALEAAGDAGLPVVNVRHLSGPSSPVFNPDLPGSQLIREVAAQRTGDWREITKHYSSIYAGTHLADWLIEQQINTVTLVGFMSHNCVLSSAVEAEALGLRTLTYHELIKVKIAGADRETKQLIINAIVRETKAAEVQSIGHILVLYRPSEEAKITLPRK